MRKSVIRKGRLSDAGALAKELAAALSPESRHASRAHFLAGHSVYLGSGSEKAVEFHLRARELAKDPEDLRQSLWGLFMTENELGSPDAEQHLAELELMAAEDDNLDTRLRVAVGRQAVGAARGSFAGLWEASSPLIPLATHAADPMARTTLCANASYLCVARADYHQGEALASRTLNECRHLGLDFAKGYCLATLALAQAGLRTFRSAHQSLRELRAIAEEQDNAYLRSSAEISLMRVSLAMGRPEEALRGRSPDYVDLIPVSASQGEYLGVLALAAAAASRPQLAKSCAERALNHTSTIEAKFFSAFADLISESASDEGVDRAVRQLTVEALDAEFADAVVIACRLRPTLRGTLEKDGSLAARLLNVMRRANEKEARDAESRSRGEALTPREREVLALLASGLSNPEIAKRLFISASTAKVHVQHILKKLGVNTRLQAAMQAPALLEDWD